MNKRSIVPPGREHSYNVWHFSPAVASGGFVFVSGCTGTAADGTISPDPVVQFRDAFRKVEHTLAHAGLKLANVVEMTTYHVGLPEHFEQFRAVKDEFVSEPYPAWTAIGISGLAVAGAIIEIRVTARQP